MTGENEMSEQVVSAPQAPQMQDLLEQMRVARERVLDGSRAEAVGRQHAKGKMTARERIAYLADPGSFVEHGALVAPVEDNEFNKGIAAPADGIVTGHARIEGRPFALIAADFTVLGGSIGTIGMHKMLRAARRAGQAGIPLVMLQEGGGHRIQDGQDSRHFSQGFGIWDALSQMSGWIPIVSAMMGPGFAAATNFSALADLVVMVRGTASMGMAGPALVKAGTGEEATIEQLGGASMQVDKHGIAHLGVDSDAECLDAIRRFLSYLPSNCGQPAPCAPTDDPSERADESLLEMVPTNLRKAYDMRKVVATLADVGSMFEVQPTYARNIVCAMARLAGRPVGFIANQPMHLGGMLDTPACEKAAHFIAVCDAFGLPLIYLIDVPGFAIGSGAEKSGLGRRSARMLYELGSSTVPRISVTLRKGYGAAFVAMNGGQPSFDAEACLAWPSAEICAMSVEGAVDVVYRKDYEAADDPMRRRQDIIDRFRRNLGALRSAEHFFVDDVIDPRDTRKVLIQTLSAAPTRRTRVQYPRHRSISPI
jgi:acetyl-CoA carboxylase carboxyltransferase component